MIVITAATGTLGPLVVEKLRERGVPPAEIVVAVRNPHKASTFAAQGHPVRHADYDDAASLQAAFVGADRLLFLSSPEFDLEKRVAQHERVIAAAMQAGVGHVIYTSFIGAEAELPGGLNAHFVTERALEQSGLPFTFLRNAFYLEGTLPAPLLRAAVSAGELKSATGGRGINPATRPDLAEATATVLTTEGHLGKAYPLVGALWTFPEVAETLSRVSGNAIMHREVPASELGPLGFVHSLTRKGVYEWTSPDLEQLLGRAPTSLEQYVTDALSSASP